MAKEHVNDEDDILIRTKFFSLKISDITALRFYDCDNSSNVITESIDCVSQRDVIISNDDIAKIRNEFNKLESLIKETLNRNS